MPFVISPRDVRRGGRHAGRRICDQPGVVAYLCHDRINHQIRGRRGPDWPLLLPGGAIPDTTKLRRHCANRTARWWDRSTRTSPSRVWRGDIILLRIHPGASKASKPARCVSKMRRVLHRPFRSGAGKRRRVRRTCRRKLRASEPISINAWIRCTASTHPSPPVQWLKQECGLDQRGRNGGSIYPGRAKSVSRDGARTQHTIVAERFFDESGGCSWSSMPRSAAG